MIPESGYPEVPFVALDTLWFQVAGTVCNLACTHCFISCSPANHAHEMLRLEDVREYLRQAARLGVREYYFTGGEPFMNREIVPMIEAALAQGPVTILTNGLLIGPELAARLKTLSDVSEYSFDVRISLDGFNAAGNDAIRGEGTFDRVLQAVGFLSAAGINPVVTVTEACEEAATSAGRSKLLEFLQGAGLPRPRLKVLSLFRIGAEGSRLRGYTPAETLKGRDLTREESERLQCSSCRMVTSKGVYVCPILIDESAARMGSTLSETLRPFPLAFPACFTCHEFGVTCRT